MHVLAFHHTSQDNRSNQNHRDWPISLPNHHLHQHSFKLLTKGNRTNLQTFLSSFKPLPIYSACCYSTRYITCKSFYILYIIYIISVCSMPPSPTNKYNDRSSNKEVTPTLILLQLTKLKDLPFGSIEAPLDAWYCVDDCLSYVIEVRSDWGAYFYWILVA